MKRQMIRLLWVMGAVLLGGSGPATLFTPPPEESRITGGLRDASERTTSHPGEPR